MSKQIVCLLWLGLGLHLSFFTSSCSNYPKLAPEHMSNSSTEQATEPNVEPKIEPSAESSPDIAKFCNTELSSLPGPFDQKALSSVCAKMQKLDDCMSVKGQPIFHFDKVGTDKLHGKKVLAISLIHGDEFPAGSVTRAWMSRLDSIDARNTWRVIPLVNPDGLKQKTRFNSRGVDLNRNFPSNDWDGNAPLYWEKTTHRDPRRFPGPAASSEPETRCLVQHIKEFNPDFIISIHTPLGVLDFDGPNIGNPGFKPLPWVGLGNYVGSLGRYMWIDRKVPVLTIELKGNSGTKRLEDFDQLQDISGTVAIQSGKLLDRTKKHE
jgi:murein peptide amidase A